MKFGRDLGNITLIQSYQLYILFFSSNYATIPRTLHVIFLTYLNTTFKIVQELINTEVNCVYT